MNHHGNTIAMYLPSMEGGGAEMVFALLTSAFVDAGLAVTLVLNRAHGPTLAHVHPAVEVVDLGASRSLSALPKLVDYLRERTPDVLLSALEVTNVTAVTARSLARVRTRVAVSVHAVVSHTIERKESWQHLHLRPFLRRAYEAADAIIAVSDTVASDLSLLTDIPRWRIARIYNPIPGDIERRASAPLDGRFANASDPIVLGIGRLVEKKNFAGLIQAFAEVRDRRRARLVLLGDGPERGRLGALARSLDLADDVVFAGHVENPDPYLARSSAVVVSSPSEGFGNVLVEALACGTSVVSTSCGGPSEILDNGRYGQLVPVGDVSAMARAIEATLNAPLDAELLKRRASEFALELIAAEYLEAMFGPQSAARAS